MLYTQMSPDREREPGKRRIWLHPTMLCDQPPFVSCIPGRSGELLAEHARVLKGVKSFESVAGYVFDSKQQPGGKNDFWRPLRRLWRGRVDAQIPVSTYFPRSATPQSIAYRSSLWCVASLANEGAHRRSRDTPRCTPPCSVIHRLS